MSLYSNSNPVTLGVLEGVKREAGWSGEWTSLRENNNSPHLGERRGLVASQCSRTLQMMLCGFFIGTQTFWQILIPKLVIADVFHSEGITLVRMLGWRINGLCSKTNRKLFWIFDSLWEGNSVLPRLRDGRKWVSLHPCRQRLDLKKEEMLTVNTQFSQQTNHTQ